MNVILEVQAGRDNWMPATVYWYDAQDRLRGGTRVEIGTLRGDIRRDGEIIGHLFPPT